MAPFFMLQEFLNYLTAEKRFSEHTCLAYKKDIAQFLEFSCIESKKDIGEVDSKLIRGWMVYLIENDYDNSSVNRKIIVIILY